MQDRKEIIFSEEELKNSHVLEPEEVGRPKAGKSKVREPSCQVSTGAGVFKPKKQKTEKPIQQPLTSTQRRMHRIAN